MSTSQPHLTPAGRPVIPDEPRDVFPELVERNGDVCRRCYTRIREREPYPWVAGNSHGDIASFVAEIEDGRLGAYLEGERIDGRSEQAHPPGERTPTGTTGCRCGAIQTHRTPDTRSKRDAVRAAMGITATLTELDVAHDWVYLVKKVRRLKSTPEHAGNDFETFRTATAEAVRVARTGSPTP